MEPWRRVVEKLTELGVNIGGANLHSTLHLRGSPPGVFDLRAEEAGPALTLSAPAHRPTAR